MRTIDPQKNPAREVHKAILKDIEKALEQIRGRKSGRTELIHNARKKCKEVRALLRLLRDVLDRKTFHAENIRFRDIARPLSAVRDAQVLAEKTADVLSDGKLALPSRRKKTVKDYVRVHSRTVSGTMSGPGGLDATAQRFQKSLERIQTWNGNLKKAAISDVVTGLTKTYSKGRGLMNLLATEPTGRNFHEWRKQVKYLRHQIEALTGLWPNVLRNMARELAAISDALGDDHDWMILKIKLRGLKKISRNEKSAVYHEIDRRRSSLQTDALRLGSRIYAETPKAFAKHIGRLWTAAYHPLQASPN